MANSPGSPAPPPGDLRAGARVHLPLVSDLDVGGAGEGVLGPEEGSLESRLVEVAEGLGFARIGWTSTEVFEQGERHLAGWLARGFQGEMDYLAAPRRGAPRELLEQAKTVVAVAMSYGDGEAVSETSGDLQASVARYARGDDYHRVLKEKLWLLADKIATLTGRPVCARACVDTAPLLEHEVAARAGIGFTAKNTLTIVPGVGSYVVLGELLLDVDLLPLLPPASPRCGSCRACLDACPTQAFVGAHVLDARACISYLTIERKGTIPRELRAAIGTRVFGCDVCQDVCPFNSSGKGRSGAPELSPKRGLLDLERLLKLRSGEYRRLVRGSAMRRVSRTSLQRNAAVALGNTAAEKAVAPLSEALAENSKAVVREHAAWALGELGFTAAEPAIRAAMADEAPEVRREAALALPRLTRR